MVFTAKSNSFAFRALLLWGVVFGLSASVRAGLRLPAVLGDNMVLQQGQADPVWGWDTPGASVTVKFAGQTKTAKADEKGRWSIKLDAMPASSAPTTMVIDGSSHKEIKNILVGEVWLCSGQSNMALTLDRVWNAEVEAAGLKHPHLRLLNVPNTPAQEPQEDFQGEWKPCTPESGRDFSALALFYGRYLHQALGVPVGLIHNAWGGSTIEAWMDRKLLENDPRFEEAIGECRKREKRAADPRAIAKFETDLVAWEQSMAEWNREMEKNPLLDMRRPHRPPDPRDFLPGPTRAGNAFNGILSPTIGYGIRGVIWYQGESNVRGASVYRHLFPTLIAEWRKLWAQGDFPFYWVQLPNYGAVETEPGDSPWAELREAQTGALALPHTGQCVTVDLGDPTDLHPRNKLDVAARLARWALANDYAVPMPFRSPQFKQMNIREGKAIVTFDFCGPGLCVERFEDVRGFLVRGAEPRWVPARAQIVGIDQVEVWSEIVPHPTEVRYGWADGPICNLFSKDGLPVTPFRTDPDPSNTAPQTKTSPSPAP